MRKLSLFLFLAVLSLSCSKDKEAEPATVLSDADLKIHFDDTHQYTLTKGTATVDPASFKWTSSDTVVGKVDQNGKFTGRRIGQTTVRAVSTDGKVSTESKVTIDPYSNLCTEPVLDFKATQAAVKAKEKRALLEEDTASVTYKGENSKLRGVAYAFSKNALVNSFLVLTETQAVFDEAATFLFERYEYLGDEDYVYYFTNNKVVVAYLEEETLGLVAIYAPYPAGGLRTMASFKETVKASFKAQFKPRVNGNRKLKFSLK